MTWRAHFCNFLFFTEILGDSQEGLQYESSSVLAGAGGQFYWQLFIICGHSYIYYDIAS